MSFCPPRRIRVRIPRTAHGVRACLCFGRTVVGLPLLAGGVLGLALTQIIAPSSMNESWIDAFARIPGSSDAGAPVSKALPNATSHAQTIPWLAEESHFPHP